MTIFSIVCNDFNNWSQHSMISFSRSLLLSFFSINRKFLYHIDWLNLFSFLRLSLSLMPFVHIKDLNIQIAHWQWACIASHLKCVLRQPMVLHKTRGAYISTSSHWIPHFHSLLTSSSFHFLVLQWFFYRFASLSHSNGQSNDLFTVHFFHFILIKSPFASFTLCFLINFLLCFVDSF